MIDAAEGVLDALAEAGRDFYRRGWVLGTSGNFSVVLGRRPLRLAVTASGVDKGRLDRESFVVVDEAGAVVSGHGRPSAEARLHLPIVLAREAGAVLHTHSVWSNIVSEAFARSGAVRIEEQEMLKGLRGVTTHRHTEWVPILENAQDYEALGEDVRALLASHPSCHGFLLRRHGLYTWGEDVAEARRHVEILEYLLEVTGRTLFLPR